MGQIAAVFIVYLSAYFIKKSYVSISIAFIIILFSVFGTMFDPSSAKDNITVTNNYYEGLGIFLIDVIVFVVFFKFVRDHKQAKLNSGDIINKD